MNISFTVPLQRAWDRMVRMLFRPFALQNWIVVGFAAFLSEYLSHALGGRYSWREKHDETTRQAARRIADFFQHPMWGPTIIAIVVCAALLFILFLWLTSRGRFVFLDNVVRERRRHRGAVEAVPSTRQLAVRVLFARVPRVHRRGRDDRVAPDPGVRGGI
jgi:hypothetical protein